MGKINLSAAFKDRRFLILVAGNLIPIIGYFLFSWDLKQAFLFYLLEFCFYSLISMVKTVLFVINKNRLVKKDRDEGYSRNYIKKQNSSTIQIIFQSIGAVTFQITMFAVVVMQFIIFCLDMALGTKIFFTEYFKDIYIFIIDNYLVLIYIFIQYLYNFFYYHIHKEEYLLLPYEYQYNESWGRDIFIFMAAISVPTILFGLIFMNNSGGYLSIFQVLLLISLLIFKLNIEYYMNRRKKKLISRYDEFKKMN